MATHEAVKAEAVHLVEMVFPNATNHYGTMFGGKVLEMMDRAAFIAATRFCRLAVVTASTERIDFLVPVKQGYLVELVAKVVFAGRTSLSVKVELFAEHPQAEGKELATTGYFHMVALGPDGRPAQVPTLACLTDDDAAEVAHVVAMRNARKEADQ